ncbi:hypothetical protein BSKO_12683 [Bryopsis sp. KO-2023]|nr:hypothetical protein BSKO_12683 [Bryopsis sp. KO-2023]
MAAPLALAANDLDPVWLAHSRLRRRRFDESIELCGQVLAKTPYDQAVWYLKCRALTLKNWIEDTEIEEEGAADILLDENAIAQVARPGTSLARPLTSANGSGAPSQAVRPMTNSGRPLTGFVRPGTGNRPGTSNRPGSRTGTASVEAVLKGGRPGTTRPVTSSGRFVRLGTASLLSQPGGPFINVDRLDLRKYSARPNLARVLCDYILYHDHNPKKALELCALATKSTEFGDWWWKSRLGKCYYQLGLFRDAEKQFQSSLNNQEMVVALLELCKVYIRLDQPNTALETLKKYRAKYPANISILLAQARLHDALNDMETAIPIYKEVLSYDGSNVEAISCLGAHHFYTDQPEVALRFYRRLLQMGVNNAEIWNNLGLCCFYSSQYDLTLNCFDRALLLGGDDILADIWYNIGQVATGIGDLGLAYQAYKVAISIDNTHAESFNNLGVLEGKKGDDAAAKASFAMAQKLAGHLFEPCYNGALLCFRKGEFQGSFEQVNSALEVYPEHIDSKDLLKQLQNHFTLI